MRYLSVCSGIEAATVAWHPLGWEAAAYSEIEKFPSALLSHYYPNVPNLGDMTKINDEQIKQTGTIDLLVGGTPCQSFSVAGLRRGLEDPRGNLALVFLRLADKFKPRWIIWENVPGVLSVNGGRDFGSLLGALGQLGYSCSYRVLDAQYFGVPQRRRRVFVVANLGTDWRRSAEVLFESQSSSGHIEESRKKKKETSSNARKGIKTNSWPAEITCPLNASFGNKQGIEDQHALGGAHLFVPAVVGTLTAKGPSALGAPQVDARQYIVEGKAQGVDLYNQQLTGDLHVPLRTAGGHGAPAIMHKAPMINMQGSKGNSVAQEDGPSFTISAMHGFDMHAIGVNLNEADMRVRRLTPLECERLQGFPDNYTAIPFRNKPASECPDGPRYKALGNSMAVPVMSWIGKRLDIINKRV